MKVFATALLKDHFAPDFTTCGYIANSLWKESILKYGNIESSDIETCDYVFLFISWLGDDFVFDQKIAAKIEFLQKPIVVIDFTEYGSYHGEIHLPNYNIYGYKTENKNLLYKDHRMIHEFLIANQSLIKCYFKRELGSTIDTSVVPFKVYPIDYIHDTYVGDGTVDSMDVYLKRPIRYNFIWGYSSLSRPKLHGAILRDIDKFETLFATSFSQCNDFLRTGDQFILLNFVPYYERTEHHKLMEYQKKSRAVIDMYGCGLKCFRNSESTANCLSIKQDPTKLKWAYPWVDGENCVVLPTINNETLIDLDKSIEILLRYQHGEQHKLYPIYLNSLEMNKLYAPSNYVPNYIIKLIKS